jgi:hypothetical protein
MKHLLIFSALAFIAACHSEHVTGIVTGLWASEKCHPGTFIASYEKPPENATKTCDWQPVLPPDSTISVPWGK